jgi:hypothetical protein
VGLPNCVVYVVFGNGREPSYCGVGWVGDMNIFTSNVKVVLFTETCRV